MLLPALASRLLVNNGTSPFQVLASSRRVSAAGHSQGAAGSSIPGLAASVLGVFRRCPAGSSALGRNWPAFACIGTGAVDPRWAPAGMGHAEYRRASAAPPWLVATSGVASQGGCWPLNRPKNPNPCPPTMPRAAGPASLDGVTPRATTRTLHNPIRLRSGVSRRMGMAELDSGERGRRAPRGAAGACGLASGCSMARHSTVNWPSRSGALHPSPSCRDPASIRWKFVPWRVAHVETANQPTAA